MTNPEIPEEALKAACGAWADTPHYGTTAGLRDAMTAALAAALPHLRVQETPALPECSNCGGMTYTCGACHAPLDATIQPVWGEAEYVLREFESLMRSRVDSGKGELKTRANLNLAVLSTLRDEARLNGYAGSHPRPVVDREALLALLELHKVFTWMPMSTKALDAGRSSLADAILALLPTEEGEGS